MARVALLERLATDGAVTADMLLRLLRARAFAWAEPGS